MGFHIYRTRAHLEPALITTDIEAIIVKEHLTVHRLRPCPLSVCWGDVFHQLGPLSRVGHGFAMSVCVYVCMCVIKVVIVNNGQSIRVFLSYVIK